MKKTFHQPTMDITRRGFVKTAALSAGFAGLRQTGFAMNSMIPQRALGQTGLRCGILGLSCAHLHEAPSEMEAEAIVHAMLDHGANALELSPHYGSGLAETIVGRAVHSRRHDAILFFKTPLMKPSQALGRLRESLSRMNVEMIDVWTLHNPSMEEWRDESLRKPMLEAMRQAQRQGLCRHIGIGGMADPAWLNQFMLDEDFDMVHMPLNCVDPHYLSFEKNSLAELGASRAGIIGGKPFAMGKTFAAFSARQALGYALSLPASCALAGCSALWQARENLAVAMAHQPWVEEALESLREQSAALSGRDVEWYKRIG